MARDAGELSIRPVRTMGLEFGPTSGLALGLALSAALWALAGVLLHLLGLF